MASWSGPESILTVIDLGGLNGEKSCQSSTLAEKWALSHTLKAQRPKTERMSHALGGILVDNKRRRGGMVSIFYPVGTRGQNMMLVIEF